MKIDTLEPVKWNEFGIKGSNRFTPLHLLSDDSRERLRFVRVTYRIAWWPVIKKGTKPPNRYLKTGVSGVPKSTYLNRTILKQFSTNNKNLGYGWLVRRDLGVEREVGTIHRIRNLKGGKRLEGLLVNQTTKYDLIVELKHDVVP